MPEERADAPWRVDVYRAGRRVGAGVLVAETTILTCAHVVTTALELPTDVPRPAGAVSVGFPVLGGRPAGTAVVRPDGWHLGSSDAPLDFALLELAAPAPPPVRPAVLTAWGENEVRQSRVRIFGNPRTGSAAGTWAVASPGGAVQTGWVQLFSEPNRFVEPGFSGAGVEVTERSAAGSVCGIVASARTGEQAAISHMIPLELIARHCPPMRDLLHPVTTRLPAPVDRRLAQQLEAELRVCAMLPPADVTAVLRQIEARLRSRLRRAAPVPGGEAADPVHRLVAVCLANGGALGELVDILRERGEDPHVLNTLRQLVALADPPPLLLPAERGPLLALLAGVPPEKLAEAARYATAGGAALEAGLADAQELVSRLEMRACAPHLVPDVLKFIDHCAHGHQPISLRLHEQMWDIARRVQAPKGAVRELCHATGLWQKESSFVLMICVEEAEQARRYRCRMYIWQRNATVPYRRLHFDEPMTEEQVRDRVVALLDDSELTSGEADVPIEVFLPRSLFGLAVDRWPAFFPAPLGTRHMVVIRSLDRLRESRHHPSWRRQSRLAEAGTPFDPDLLYWHDPSIPLTSAQLFSHFNANPKYVGMVICQPPDRITDPALDPFAPALGAGLPLIIWVRQERPLSVLRSELQQLLRGRPLGALPAELVGLRARASSGVTAEHLGHHLVVLLDLADQRGLALAGQIRYQPPDRPEGLP